MNKQKNTGNIDINICQKVQMPISNNSQVNPIIILRITKGETGRQTDIVSIFAISREREIISRLEVKKRENRKNKVTRTSSRPYNSTGSRPFFTTCNSKL